MGVGVGMGGCFLFLPAPVKDQAIWPHHFPFLSLWLYLFPQGIQLTYLETSEATQLALSTITFKAPTACWKDNSMFCQPALTSV